VSKLPASRDQHSEAFELLGATTTSEQRLKDLTIAILNSRRSADLQATLALLHECALQEQIALDSLVIDNGGNPRNPLGTRVRVLYGPGDEPGGRNLVIREAKSDWLLFLDDDVVPSPGLLRAYVEAHDLDPRRSAYYGPTLFERKAAPSLAYKAAQSIALTGSFDLPARRRELEWAPTSNALFYRPHLVEVGGFRRPRGAAVGACDVDIGIRLTRRFGRSGLGVVGASCIHLAHSWSSFGINLMRFYFYGVGEASLLAWHPHRTVARSQSKRSREWDLLGLTILAYQAANYAGLLMGHLLHRRSGVGGPRFQFQLDSCCSQTH
jgi:glycosyltransferase involved in cell wall biosynthesis